MYTKADFLRIIESNIDDYPNTAIRYRAQDPRITQSLQSIAQMAAMLSEQVELTGMEGFERARDTTVLADAALKGILPKASPCQVVIIAQNNNSDSVQVQAGRGLLDAVGRSWEALENTTIAAGGSGMIRAIQKTTRIINHTFLESEPFSQVAIDAPESDQYIAGMHVLDANGVAYEYRQRFTNTEPGERVYNVITDEYRRLFVVFGYDGVVGYQPSANEVVQIQVTDTYGNVTPKLGSPFVFEYANSPLDSRLAMKMNAVEVSGIDPPDIRTLRELTSYPSIYDDSAVYHGEFDRLLRKEIPHDFLSVWNEQLEEELRGASQDHINKAFISISPATSAVRNEIMRIFRYADDSYRFGFIAPVESLITISVSGSVARVYPFEQVIGQIRTLLLATYGKGTAVSRRGMVIPSREDVRRLLRKSIQALQDDNADYDVTVSYPMPVMPEHWHYVTDASITVTITESNFALSRWGR